MFYIICIILCIVNVCFSCYLFYRNCMLNDELDSLSFDFNYFINQYIPHISSDKNNNLSQQPTSSDILNKNSKRSSSDNVKNLIRNY